MTARVRVPASSSNLGAGFDCIGIAVDCSSTVAGATVTHIPQTVQPVSTEIS